MAKEKKDSVKEITIDGYIEEAELEDGNPGLQLATHERDFFIEMDKVGKKLLDFVDEEVELTGTVSKLKGHYRIKVLHFRALDSFEDDEDELSYEDDDDFLDDRRYD